MSGHDVRVAYHAAVDELVAVWQQLGHAPEPERAHLQATLACLQAEADRINKRYLRHYDQGPVGARGLEA